MPLDLKAELRGKKDYAFIIQTSTDTLGKERQLALTLHFCVYKLFCSDKTKSTEKLMSLNQ